MSKRSDYKPERNPLFVVLYIVAVVLLLGCLVFFVFMSKERQKMYKEQTKQAAENETEYIMTERVRETETETETSKREKTKPAMPNKTASSRNAAVDSEKKSDEAMMETEDQSERAPEETDEPETLESDSEKESETTREKEYTISSSEKMQTILVLNGTKKPGVAGAWKEQLQKLGYRHVVSASYTGEIEDHTVIYAEQSAKVEGLQHQFSNSETKVGKVENGIEPGEGEKLPEEIDVYVVVGRNNTTVENSMENE
ncbi:MAG: LytR C-terminal domain-containing protein [Lachnospiraceae bacterium]|nr:LytR C-terminal domain-containing protein [Lachnospiraceae bacterium]